MSVKDVKKVADSVAGYLYSHFILRDFCFLGSGTAFLFVASHLLGYGDYLFGRTVYTLMFFGAAYFVGLLMQEICLFLRIFKMTPSRKPEGRGNDKEIWALCVYQLHKKKDVQPAAIVAIERTAYIKQVASAFGSAAFFAALFALIHGLLIGFSDLHYWTLGVGTGLFLFCIEANGIKVDLQYKSKNLLLESEDEQK